MRLLLFLSFLALPVLEIYVILQVGGLIGTWWVVALLVADSILGAWVVRYEGIRAWRALHDALQTGRMPDQELANAALILIGGSLLLTPGFVTDAAGFLAVLPPTRPVVRGILWAAVKRRLQPRVQGDGPQMGAAGAMGPTGARRWRQRGSGGQRTGTRQQAPGTSGRQGEGRQSPGAYEDQRVVRGEVIDDPRE